MGHPFIRIILVLFLTCIVSLLGGLSINIARTQNLLMRWEQLPLPPLTASSLVQANATTIVVQDRDQQLALCTVRVGMTQCWETFDHPGPMLQTPTWNIGLRPCPSTHVAFHWVNAPPTMTDCLYGKESYADGTIAFVYVLDSQHRIWRWARTRTVDSDNAWIPLYAYGILGLFGGTILSLLVVSLAPLLRRFARPTSDMTNMP